MRRLLALVLLVQALHGGLANAAAKNLVLVVTDPYLEMHSGPGRGYPVIYVVGRDEVLKVLYRRTDWYKVRAPRGQEGWARRSELALTLTTSGDPAPIPPGAAPPPPDQRVPAPPPAVSRFHHPPLGDRRGVRRVQSSELGHRLAG